MMGDLRFRAPEVIQGKPYSFKADTWSVGVILFYTLTLKFPIEARDGKSLEKCISNGEPNIKELSAKGYSETCCNLLTKLLQKDLNKRLEVGNYLSHKWF